MLGIVEVASYIPERKTSNYTRKKKFGIDDQFILEKLGVEEISIKEPEETTSDLCVKAFNNLQKKVNLDKNDIDVVVVVTQNPDHIMPQTATIMQGKLGLRHSCASFDISLGCSGFVYGLRIIESFMNAQGYKNGLLFTCDPYTGIISQYDKNTSMLFGDAAAVTYLSTENVKYSVVDVSYGSMGENYKSEIVCENKELFMNGRAVSNFVAKVVPPDMISLLKKHNYTLDDMDIFLLHQGSKFIVDMLARKLGVPEEKVVFDIYKYGNTVSSSIPIMLEKQLNKEDAKLIMCSGFGVGLSWGNLILKRC